MASLAGAVKTYGTGPGAVRALDGVDVAFDTGAFTAVMGPSGSGKSTLLHCCVGLDRLTQGRAMIGETELGSLRDRELTLLRRTRVGFVFQSFNLIPRTAAIVNVELPMVYAGMKKHARRQRAEHALAAVGLTDRMHHLPSELSGGQQQRVAVARAIATNPAIILADEPTGNLDSHATLEVLDIFSRLNSEGRTVVLITHEDDVADVAKRVIRLRDGEVIEDRRQGPVSGPPPRYHSHGQSRPGAPRPEGAVGTGATE